MLGGHPNDGTGHGQVSRARLSDRAQLAVISEGDARSRSASAAIVLARESDAL
jgi:hypothetical protein